MIANTTLCLFLLLASAAVLTAQTSTADTKVGPPCRTDDAIYQKHVTSNSSYHIYKACTTTPEKPDHNPICIDAESDRIIWVAGADIPITVTITATASGTSCDASGAPFRSPLKSDKGFLVSDIALDTYKGCNYQVQVTCGSKTTDPHIIIHPANWKLAEELQHDFGTRH